MMNSDREDGFLDDFVGEEKLGVTYRHVEVQTMSPRRCGAICYFDLDDAVCFS